MGRKRMEIPTWCLWWWVCALQQEIYSLRQAHRRNFMKVFCLAEKIWKIRSLPCLLQTQGLLKILCYIKPAAELVKLPWRSLNSSPQHNYNQFIWEWIECPTDCLTPWIPIQTKCLEQGEKNREAGMVHASSADPLRNENKTNVTG